MMKRVSKGFSLIELMVAMAAGLVVIGAVVVFTIATAQSTSKNIRTTRVMQNLRNSMNVIEREIRRSGFDERAIRFANACSDPTVPASCPQSNFNQLVVVNSSCIAVLYDNAANATPGTIVAGEYHGFRLATKSGVGVIQASLAGASVPTCTAAATDTNWTDLTDPNVVNITALSFTDTFTPTVNGGGCTKASNGLWIVVQDVQVALTGQWVDPTTSLITQRSLEESVRVKNDRVSTTKPSVCS
jgi:prepilin-type N-terminal cleavage/methylation domain-containing protein